MKSEKKEKIVDSEDENEDAQDVLTNVLNKNEKPKTKNAAKDEYQNFSKELADKLKADISSILAKHSPQRGMVFYYDRKSLGKFRPLFLHVLDEFEDVYEWNFEPRALDSRRIDVDYSDEKKKFKNRVDIQNKSAELLHKLSEKWHRKQDGVSAIQDGEFEFYDRK